MHSSFKSVFLLSNVQHSCYHQQCIFKFINQIQSILLRGFYILFLSKGASLVWVWNGEGQTILELMVIKTVKSISKRH